MKTIDLLVFGASGFTGKYVVEMLVEFCGNDSGVRWGLAGRSQEKIQRLLLDIEGKGVKLNALDIPILVADATDYPSLVNMTSQTRVLLNCAGPYSVTGDAVVKACIQTGTHCLDITAEKSFVMQIYSDHHKTAEDANVLIISACAFASIPADMGTVFMEKNFDGTLNSVDCYTLLEFPKRVYIPCGDHTLVSYGTWSSLIQEFKLFRTFRQMDMTVFPEDVYHYEHNRTDKSYFHRHNGKCWFPYPGPDKSIINMTQRYLHNKRKKHPTLFNIYTTTPICLHLIILVPVFFIYYYLSYFKCFRGLLKKFPRLFTLGYISHKGPSERNMRDIKFTFTLNGRGWRGGSVSGECDATQTVKVTGSDPYLTTAMTLVLSAVTLIKEESNIPRGGVLTPGAAFYNTTLIDRLQKNGLTFETIK